MNAERIQPADMVEILSWWEDRHEGTLPLDILPPVGVCASDAEGRKLAAAWLYQPIGCGVVIIDWLVTAPGLGPMEARLACRSVFAELERIARESGSTRIFCTVTRSGMEREAESCGFYVVVRDAVHLIKDL